MRDTTPKTCIFCGRTGLTKQHVLPDWIKNVLPRDKSNFVANSVYSRIDTNTGRVLSRDPKKILKNGHQGTQKIRNVCANCNGGWMNDIEIKVKPFLSEMILGKTIKLNIDQQLELTKWVVMTSIMGEFTDRRGLAIPVSHRKILMEQGRPGETWKIWLGRYVGDEWSVSYKHIASSLKIRNISVGTPAIYPNIQFTTIVLGAVFIHASSFLPGVPVYNVTVGSTLLTPLWPSSEDDLIWPPYQIIGDESAEIISEPIRFPGSNPYNI